MARALTRISKMSNRDGRDSQVALQAPFGCPECNRGSQEGVGPERTTVLGRPQRKGCTLRERRLQPSSLSGGYVFSRRTGW